MPARREQGFALLIVLWSMALLALLGAHITAAGGAETRLAANLRSNAAAEAAADGAVYEAVFRLLDHGGRHWDADSVPRALRFGRAAAEVRIDNQAGKIPLNTSPVVLLQTLLQTVGVDQRNAAAMAATIADWRSPATWPMAGGAKAPQYRAAGLLFGPPNAPFRTVDELGMVLGMTPSLFQRLRPHVTVYTEAVPQPSNTDPIVARAVTDAQASGQPSLTFDEAPTVLITATAALPDGARFTRRAVVRIIAGDQFATERGAFKVLMWQSGGG